MKRGGFASVFLLAAALGRGAPPLSLDGEWRIATDPQNAGRERQWYAAGPVAEALPVRVPGVLESAFPGYDGVVWYWREFDIAPAGPMERLILKFHAADYLAEVWLNGYHLGRHEGGETPFSFDVTGQVRATGNRLAVRLVNPGRQAIDGLELEDTPRSIKFSPMQVGVFWNCGGLWQRVEILRVPAVRLVDVFADARLEGRTVALRLAIRNDLGRPVSLRLRAEAARSPSGPVLAERAARIEVTGRELAADLELRLPGARPWSPDAPALYQVRLRLDSPAGPDSQSLRVGFREFVFRDGYFRLNGRRMYVKSAHSTGHFPIGQHAAEDPEWLRRELVYAKAMGFNMVRMIAKMMYPEQLDFCDELGLMVYEESFASWGPRGEWGMRDAAATRVRFGNSIREMILRDRNHPSVVMWGLLNETRDGPLFRQAVEMLPMVRGLDASRVVMLNSGRWDGRWSVGSLSNPRTGEWAHAFGSEAPQAAAVDFTQTSQMDSSAGDLHRYPARPWSSFEKRFFRTVGAGRKSIFLSEYGNGSQIDPVRLVRLFEQYGARADLDDARLYRGMCDRLEADWKRWELDRVFASPSDVIRAGEAVHSEQRRLAVDAIRANPGIIGFNITGLSDQCVEGEGLITTFREPKHGAVEAMADALAPLRWSVFAEPVHFYPGGRLRVEAVLANEDVLRPGEYPVRLRIAGPAGVVYEKRSRVTIPDPRGAPEPPMVLPAFDEELTLEGPPGTYQIVAGIEKGAAATGRQTVVLGDPAQLPKTGSAVAVWEARPQVAPWLAARGAAVSAFGPARSTTPHVIVVGEVRPDETLWREFAARVSGGNNAIVLSPAAAVSVPGVRRPRLDPSAGRYWGRDDVVRPHPVFAGLPAGRVMDLVFYRDLVPAESFVAFDEAAEVLVPCFGVGRPSDDGYWSGANMLLYRIGEGRVVVTTLRLLENLGKHPAADRILSNLIAFAAANPRQKAD